MKKSVVIGIFLLCLLFFFKNFMPSTKLFERFVKSNNVLGVRQDIWANALSIWSEQPFGVGEKGYLDEMVRRYSMTWDTHNLFIYILVTGGIQSLILFFIYILILLKKAYKNLKDGSTFPFIAFIVILLIAAKTGGVLTYLIMWYYFAVIDAWPKLAHRSL